MKYTELQKHRALKKLAIKYAKWNKILPYDDETRDQRTYEFHMAVFKVIMKLGYLDDYFLAIGDVRGKKK